MNQILGKVNCNLTTAFELVHQVPPDTHTWFTLFSFVCLYKNTKKNKDRSTFQGNTMQGISVGRSTKTNTLSVYNPRTKQYYKLTYTSLTPLVSPSTISPPKSTMTEGSMQISIATST